MIQTRASVRLLKYLGIVLVALPEPFTTPFGVALLFTAYNLSQELKSEAEHLLETSGYLSYWFKRPSDYVAVDSSAQGTAKSYSQNEKPPTPWPQESSRNLEAGADHLLETFAYSSYWFKRHDNYANVEASAPVAAKSYSQNEKKPTHQPHESSRNLKTNPHPPVGQPRYDARDVVYHTIDMPMLYRRYRIASRH